MTCYATRAASPPRVLIFMSAFANRASAPRSSNFSGVAYKDTVSLVWYDTMWQNFPVQNRPFVQELILIPRCKPSAISFLLLNNAQTVVSYFKSFLKIFLSFVFTRCMPHMKTLPSISPYTQVEGGQRQMSHACNEFRGAFKSREMSHQVFLANPFWRKTSHLI